MGLNLNNMKTEKDYSLIELFGYLILGLAIGIPLTIYSAWTVTKVIAWYNLPVQLSLRQIWAILQLYSLMTPTPKDEEGKKFSKVIKGMFSRAFTVSFILGLLYLIHLLWN